MTARNAGIALGVLGVAALLVLLALGLRTTEETALAIGDPVPDKELPVLGGEDTQSLADYRGRWVLVNFWASWCEPCRDEAPALEELQRSRGGPDFTVMGIDLDDNTDDALEFVSRYELTYPQLRDGDGRERRDAFGMTGFPESFLVDPEGKIALIRRGPVTGEFLQQEVVPLLPPQVKR